MTEYDQCQTCYGYCCNAYNITKLIEGEVERIAAYLEIPENDFRERYITNFYKSPDNKGKPEDWIKKAKPCPFWTMGQCGIHEVKPLSCALFEPRDTQEHCKEFHMRVRGK
jgi:Fe-S-cluster containining protein